MPSSTSARVIGFELARVTDDQIATILKLAPKDVPAKRKQLVEQHTDPAWIARELETLPSATLAVLHLVIAGGGFLLESDAYRAAKEQFAMGDRDVNAAATVALQRLFLVPLQTSRGDVLFGVSHPAAAQIAPLIAGLDALPVAPEAFVATEHVVRNPRTFLAICAATRHVDIKLTNEGRPHRTATKRLAKQVGIDDRVVEEVLGAGLATEVLRVDGDVLRPEPAALAEAAAGRYPFSPLIAAIGERLAAGPTAIRGLLHSLLRRHDLSASGYVGSDSFLFLPGFVTGTIDGEIIVALREPEGVPSGHVTPSFEVMLPPESPLLDIVQVGACCDWERLDRAIVGRISKASVMRAVAAGASASELLAHLGAASRHPIPQNVEAAIRDWAGSVVAATIGRGYVVQVEPGARDRVATGMISLGARELAPGVFLIEHERDTGLREIQTMLSRAGALPGEAAP
ncbi:MAG: helicase-associated domain-containing protein, partial [Myxococcales bacterium]|nr:helicase-associated domain-containing protein [Myxococcales bacterium]